MSNGLSAPWAKLFDTLGMATFFLMAAFSAAILIDFLTARYHRHRHNIPGMSEWISFWSGLSVLFSLVGLGRLERLTDFWPDTDLARWQQILQYIPNCVVLYSMFRLWRRNHFTRE